MASFPAYVPGDPMHWTAEILKFINIHQIISKVFPSIHDPDPYLPWEKISDYVQGELTWCCP